MQVISVRRMALAAGAVGAGLALAACSGNGSGARVDGGDGSDEGFARAICSSVEDFRNQSMQRIASNPGALTSEESLSKVLAAPFEQFVKDFANAKAPDDMKSWHDSATEELERVSKNVKDGKGAAEIFADTTLFEEPPADIQARLVTAAKNVSECQGAEVVFGAVN